MAKQTSPTLNINNGKIKAVSPKMLYVCNESTGEIDKVKHNKSSKVCGFLKCY